MTTNHARSCLLSATMALLSAACFSSSTTGSTGGGGGSTTGNSASGSGSGGSGGGAACQPAIVMGALFVAEGWQIATLDPATGAVTPRSALPAVTGILQSGSAYDPVTKHLYLFADDMAFQRTLLTIDGPTGATLATVNVADYTTTNPEVVSGGALFVLHQPGGGSWKTATLDAALGTVASLSGPIAQDGFMVSRGFDPRTNLIYELGSRDGQSRVLTINGATGTLLLDIPMADFNFDSAVVNGAGQILGMHHVGFGLDWNVAHLDPMTGAITNLAPISLNGVVSGLSTFDPCTNRVYQMTSDGVLTADGTSGAVISLVPLPGAQWNFATIEAVW